MEEKKRKFDFHVEICEAKDQVLVTADAEKPLIGEMLACAVGVVNYVAQSIAFNSDYKQNKVLRKIADVIAGLADEDKESE